MRAPRTCRCGRRPADRVLPLSRGRIASAISVGAVSKAINSAIAGVIVVSVGLLSATGRLPRNLFAGIRIPSTLRSDQAWRAGHRAAAAALVTAGVGPIAAGVVARARKADGEGLPLLLRAGNAWLLGWIGLASIQARRAARATDAG